MTIKNVALINEENQVVNHIVIDTEDESAVADLLSFWKAVRYVETVATDVIHLDPHPAIWTLHGEEEGFIPPDLEALREEGSLPPIITYIEKDKLPADSLLLEENAANRPEGWEFPKNHVFV